MPGSEPCLCPRVCMLFACFKCAERLPLGCRPCLSHEATQRSSSLKVGERLVEGWWKVRALATRRRSGARGRVPEARGRLPPPPPPGSRRAKRAPEAVDGWTGGRVDRAEQMRAPYAQINMREQKRERQVDMQTYSHT